MAVLRGNEENVGTRSNPTLKTDTNAIIGNKNGLIPLYDEIILKKSAQVLPLVKFQQDKITNAAFADTLWAIHQQIQHQVLDEFFNNSVRTEVARVLAGTLRSAIPVPNAYPHRFLKKQPAVASPMPTTRSRQRRSQSNERKQVRRTAQEVSKATKVAGGLYQCPS